MADTYTATMTVTSYDPGGVRLVVERAEGTDCPPLRATYQNFTWFQPRGHNWFVVRWTADEQGVVSGELPGCLCLFPRRSFVNVPCMESLCEIVETGEYCFCSAPPGGPIELGECVQGDGELVYATPDVPQFLKVSGIELFPELVLAFDTVFGEGGRNDPVQHNCLLAGWFDTLTWANDRLATGVVMAHNAGTPPSWTFDVKEVLDICVGTYAQPRRLFLTVHLSPCGGYGPASFPEWESQYHRAGRLSVSVGYQPLDQNGEPIGVTTYFWWRFGVKEWGAAAADLNEQQSLLRFPVAFGTALDFRTTSTEAATLIGETGLLEPAA